MPGITPNEGENLINRILYQRDLADRDANLELGLFTNASVSEATTLADITEPAAGGYARIDLTDASWTVSGDQSTYAQQVFNATGGNFGNVYGYFIATKAASGTPRLLHLEVDPNGPRNVTDGSSYSVNLSNTVA